MVQIQSLYAKSGQTVFTLFMNEDGSLFCIVDDIQSGEKRHIKISSVKVSEQDLEWIKSNLVHVWGVDPDLYVIRCFCPLTFEFKDTISRCWNLIKESEQEFFA